MNNRRTSPRKFFDALSGIVLLAYLHTALVFHLAHTREWPPIALVPAFALAFIAWHFTEKLLQRLFRHESTRPSVGTRTAA